MPKAAKETKEKKRSVRVIKGKDKGKKRPEETKQAAVIPTTMPIEMQKPVEDPFSTLKFVLMTEKAIQLIESQNKLVFIVDRRKDKGEIKQAAEAAFQSDVKHVNTMIDQLGRKKAFIKFKEPGQAGEIAIRLGII